MTGFDRGYPVVPDGASTIDAAIPPVKIWLLDHSGKRMGAQQSAELPDEQALGVFYRITFESGEVRAGYADKQGLLVEYGVHVVGRTARLEWGDSSDQHARSRGMYVDDWPEGFLYDEEITFDAIDELTPAQQLGNLGYVGQEADQRALFAADYGSSDDSAIADVYETGRERGDVNDQSRSE